MLEPGYHPRLDRLTPDEAPAGKADAERASERYRERDPLDAASSGARALAMALESFTRAFWPLGSALAAGLGGAGLRAGRDRQPPRAPGLLSRSSAPARRLAALSAASAPSAGRAWPRRGRGSTPACRGGRWRRCATRRRSGATTPARSGSGPRTWRGCARLAAAARAVPADLRLASRDPWALRLLALVALIAALIFAQRPRCRVGHRGAGAGAGAPAVAAGPSFEGWAEPPAYTGRPDALLAGGPGRRAGLGAAGHHGHPPGLRRRRGLRARRDRLARRAPAALAEAAPGIAIADLPGGGGAARWRCAAAAPRSATGPSWWSPTSRRRSRWPTPLERAPTGETRLGYAAQDDHGVAGARAIIALDLAAVDRRLGLATEPEPRPDLVVELPLPMSGDGRELAETLVEDFSKHPWAGLPVTIRLEAEDAIGQIGATEAAVRRCFPARRVLRPARRGAGRAAPRPALVARQRPPRHPGAAGGHPPARRGLRQPARLSRRAHRHPPARRGGEGGQPRRRSATRWPRRSGWRRR